jgi:NAD(P)-dependent dehydrogenase (short-subunit alcohol dehydrogenase family)
MTETTARRWLITGVSTGLGRDLMKAALARGDTVVGTLRDMSRKAEIEAMAPGRAFVVALNVDDAARAGPAVEEALAALGGRLDILVNNAAFGIFGPVEVCTDDDFRGVMETNFFGLLRLTRAALPHLRESKGTLVNYSSVAGLVGSPGFAPYNASKFAVEGLSECLAEELKAFGVKVMVVNPDAFKSEFFADRAQNIRADAAGVYAGTPGGSTAAALDAYVGHEPGDPEKLTAAVLTALDSPQPPFRLVLGAMGLASVQAKVDRLKADMDAWRDVSLATAYDR